MIDIFLCKYFRGKLVILYFIVEFVAVSGYIPWAPCNRQLSILIHVLYHLHF